MKPCPNCGRPVSLWRRVLLSTRLCYKCDKTEEAKVPWNLSNLTVFGWLLTLATIVVIFVIAFLCGAWLDHAFPRAGRGIMALGGLAGVMIGVVFFAAWRWVLSFLGIRLWKIR